MIRCTFLIEQQVGHRTSYENLRRFLDDGRMVETEWVPVTYDGQGAV